ncbi:MAG: hypothetical protein IJO76_03855 [Clostridia bacterium]|nr:hypothetical protein [Clostridia bacterium]
MKKAVIFLFTLALVMSLTVPAFATGGFIGSPAGNRAPTLENVENENEDCTVDVEVISYADRDELNEDDREEIEDAYQQIVNMTEGSVLANAFRQIATNGNINADDLAVSDLFTMVFENCDDHDAHGVTTVTLTTETIEHFAGLLTFEDGKWGVVAAEKYSVNGDKLTFEGEAIDAYAVVVDTTEMETSPVTSNGGENGTSSLWIVLMAVSALGLVVVGVLYGRVRKTA